MDYAGSDIVYFYSSPRFLMMDPEDGPQRLTLTLTLVAVCLRFPHFSL